MDKKTLKKTKMVEVSTTISAQTLSDMIDVQIALSADFPKIFTKILKSLNLKEETFIGALLNLCADFQKKIKEAEAKNG